MKEYYIELHHLGADGWKILKGTIEAETEDKAKYKAFKQYVEAFRPSGGLNSFGWFLKYVLLKIEKLER